MSTLTATETQMLYSGDVFGSFPPAVIFRSPHPETLPFYMPSEQWERMGRPDHIRVRVHPVHANGIPWHED